MTGTHKPSQDDKFKVMKAGIDVESREDNLGGMCVQRRDSLPWVRPNMARDHRKVSCEMKELVDDFRQGT